MGRHRKHSAISSTPDHTHVHQRRRLISPESSPLPVFQKRWKRVITPPYRGRKDQTAGTSEQMLTTTQDNINTPNHISTTNPGPSSSFDVPQVPHVISLDTISQYDGFDITNPSICPRSSNSMDQSLEIHDDCESESSIPRLSEPYIHSTPLVIQVVFRNHVMALLILGTTA